MNLATMFCPMCGCTLGTGCCFDCVSFSYFTDRDPEPEEEGEDDEDEDDEDDDEDDDSDSSWDEDEPDDQEIDHCEQCELAGTPW